MYLYVLCGIFQVLYYIIFLLIICIDEEYMLINSKDYLNGNNKGIWSLYLVFFLNA